MPAFAKSFPLTSDNPASAGRFRLLTRRSIDGMEQIHVVVSRFKSSPPLTAGSAGNYLALPLSLVGSQGSKDRRHAGTQRV